MPTSTDYKDLVIDTPEAAAAFEPLFRDYKPYKKKKDPRIKEADAEFMRLVALDCGYKEK